MEIGLFFKILLSTEMHWKLTLHMGTVNQPKCVPDFNVQANHLGILVHLQFCKDQMEPMTTFLTNPPGGDASAP